MRPKYLITPSILVLCIISLRSDKLAVNFMDEPMVPIIMKFRLGELPTNHQYNTINKEFTADLREVFLRFGIGKIESVLKNRYDHQGNLKKELSHNNDLHLENWQKTHVPLSKVDQFVAHLSSLDGVERTLREIPIEMKPAVEPDDPRFGIQWHLGNNTDNIMNIDV